MSDAVDLKKSIGSYAAKHGEFAIVDVPDLQYLMLDGEGDPNTTPAFTASIETLYPIAYALKFAGRRERGVDHVVMPLEGLWWADDPRAFTTAPDRSRWRWTLMIMVPDWVDEDAFAAAVAHVASRRSPARLEEVRLSTLAEGRCVQTLHLGPFSTEGEVLDRMHNEVIPGHGFSLRGAHHEIYLSDFRRVAPEKLRTILRQPVTDADPPDQVV